MEESNQCTYYNQSEEEISSYADPCESYFYEFFHFDNPTIDIYRFEYERQITQENEFSHKENPMPTRSLIEELNIIFNGNKTVKLSKKVIAFIYNLMKRNLKNKKWEDITSHDMRSRKNLINRISQYKTEILEELHRNLDNYIILTHIFIKKEKEELRELKNQKMLKQFINK